MSNSHPSDDYPPDKLPTRESEDYNVLPGRFSHCCTLLHTAATPGGDMAHLEDGA